MMTAVSSGPVWTVSNVPGCPASAAQNSSAPSIGDSVAAGFAGSRKKCSQPSACSKPGAPSRRAEAPGCPRSRRTPSRPSRPGGRRSPRLEQDVQRDDHRARLERPEVHHREVGEVRAGQRHLVARSDAARPQQVRDLVRDRVDERVGEPHVAEHDGVAFGRLLAASSSSTDRLSMALLARKVTGRLVTAESTNGSAHPAVRGRGKATFSCALTCCFGSHARSWGSAPPRQALNHRREGLRLRYS